MHKSWQSEVFGDGIESHKHCKKYSYAWSRWKAWASEKIGVDVLPAQPLIVALYINDLLESSKSVSVLESAFYAIGSDSLSIHGFSRLCRIYENGRNFIS